MENIRLIFISIFIVFCSFASAQLPNPSNGHFEIDLEQIEEDISLQIFNIQGILYGERNIEINNLVYKKLKVNLSERQMYILVLKTNNYSKTTKLTKI